MKKIGFNTTSFVEPVVEGLVCTHGTAHPGTTADALVATYYPTPDSIEVIIALERRKDETDAELAERLVSTRRAGKQSAGTLVFVGRPTAYHMRKFPNPWRSK